jgi:hypothetical protein
MLANVNLAQDLKLLAPQGRVVVIGSRGDVTISPRDLMTRRGSIHGFTLWGVTEAEEKEIHAVSLRVWRMAHCARSSVKSCRSPRRRVPTGKSWSLAPSARSFWFLEGFAETFINEPAVAIRSSGRATGSPEIIPGQKSASGKSAAVSSDGFLPSDGQTGEILTSASQA